LQPLIEKAVYHGTKFVRHKGFIRITTCNIDEMIQFKVIDNGIGIPAVKLAEIRKELAKGIDSDFSIGYGLFNVKKRLHLYFGTVQK
ncbi:sensor histidine kinase, partial [Enterococcus faecium]|uniref:sensor histidine kinase n=1 Tax=Enterococcus faecium TaxID=1352 RepID=UPI003CC60AA8